MSTREEDRKFWNVRNCKCGGLVDFTYEEDRKYLFKCQDCGLEVKMQGNSKHMAACMWNANHAQPPAPPTDKERGGDGTSQHRE